MLMVVRVKESKTTDTFKGSDHGHKQELLEIISDYDGLFQEPRRFPPKWEVQHEIHLQ